MQSLSPIRALQVTLALAVVLTSGLAGAQYRHRNVVLGEFHTFQESQVPTRQAPAPIERRPPHTQPTPPSNSTAPNRPSSYMGSPSGTRGEHLAEWMNQHSSLTPEQQKQALEQEPGFRNLPSQTQQRMRDRLAQLDAMPPQRRQRLLDRTEAIEHLNLDQRAEVRGAMQQLGSLPPEQRRAVARSFRELRDLPADQRFAAMNSDRYRWMNDTQRSALGNLLRVEPLLPPPDSARQRQ
ncbi:MAG TPA: DUF3106 domain-containing protein [Acidobacteriaceae bacterium]|nr:DUF3106 domain-containing protein [Acidobacteriaceae bacterium]